MIRINSEENFAKSSKSAAPHAANRRVFMRVLSRLRAADAALEALPDQDWIDKTPALRRCEAASMRAYRAVRSAAAPDLDALVEKARVIMDDGDAASLILADLERLMASGAIASA